MWPIWGIFWTACPNNDEDLTDSGNLWPKCCQCWGMCSPKFGKLWTTSDQIRPTLVYQCRGSLTKFGPLDHLWSKLVRCSSNAGQVRPTYGPNRPEWLNSARIGQTRAGSWLRGNFRATAEQRLLICWTSSEPTRALSGARGESDSSTFPICRGDCSRKYESRHRMGEYNNTAHEGAGCANASPFKTRRRANGWRRGQAPPECRRARQSRKGREHRGAPKADAASTMGEAIYTTGRPRAISANATAIASLTPLASWTGAISPALRK